MTDGRTSAALSPFTVFVPIFLIVTALPADYYHFDPVHHRLSGERSGRSFRLGDSVEVKVMRVDLDERKIDFELSQDKPGKGDEGVKALDVEVSPLKSIFDTIWKALGG